MSLKIDEPTCNAYLKKVHDILLETAVYIQYYKQMFCYNQNRVDIINESAGTFFVMCRNSIVESIIMRLSKITDPASMGRFNNLSVRTLLHNIVPDTHQDYSKIDAQIQTLEANLESIRDKRNKHLGHLDLDSFDKDYPITLAELDQAVRMLGDIFNALTRHLPKGMAFDPETTIVFDPILDFKSDARAALIMLERGRRFVKMVNELPDECTQNLIPEGERYYGRHYFQHAILQYIDEKQDKEDG